MALQLSVQRRKTGLQREATDPQSKSGSLNGYPRRSGFPAAGSVFLDSRANLFFPDVPTLDAFEAAAKAGLDALATSSTTTTLVSESYSAGV